MSPSAPSTAFASISRRPATRQTTAGGGIHWPWLKPLKQLGEIVAAMALMSVGSAVKPAAANPARIPFSASLGVTPPIAGANAPRVLAVTAHFPLGCGPADATLSRTTVDGVSTLDVRLDQPSPDFAFCDLVLVPYTVELTYTPSEEGDLPVRMLTSDGVLVGESIVMTRRAKRDGAQFDVTGKWIDPAGKETGLAFVAYSPSDESVVGTWNFHDYQGVRRRYSIESVHWNEPDVEAEGAIFETTVSSAIAPSPDLSPPTANQLGLARITFHGRDCARIFALGFGGNVLFTSNLVRTTF